MLWTESYQVFQCLANIQDRLNSAADDQSAASSQLGQVGGHVHRLLTIAMHSTYITLYLQENVASIGHRQHLKYLNDGHGSKTSRFGAGLAHTSCSPITLIKSHFSSHKVELSQNSFVICSAHLGKSVLISP